MCAKVRYKAGRLIYPPLCVREPQKSTSLNGCNSYYRMGQVKVWAGGVQAPCSSRRKVGGRGVGGALTVPAVRGACALLARTARFVVGSGPKVRII